MINRNMAQRGHNKCCFKGIHHMSIENGLYIFVDDSWPTQLAVIIGPLIIYFYPPDLVWISFKNKDKLVHPKN